MIKNICIVQARMGSERLPGKVVENIEGKPMIYHIIRRLESCRNINDIIVATSHNSKDDYLVDILNKYGIKYFRGSENDVLSRYSNIVQDIDVANVIRITGDCPLVDPELIDDVIYTFNMDKNIDYLSPRSKDGLIRGLDVEIFKKTSLIYADENCKDIFLREHVTPYIYMNPDKFIIEKFPIPYEFKRQDIRLCVDEYEDLKLVKLIYSKFYSEDKIIDVRDVIKFLDSNPEYKYINLDVNQRSI